MKHRVYCHIGLPKTATTTLQLDYFPHLDKSRYVYLGVAQPRGDAQSDVLYTQIMKAINSGEGIEAASVALQLRIKKERKSIVFSEEMLTVSVSNLPWQEKLLRLKEVLEGTDYSLLVTVREPVSAMFSFYLELYSRFRDENEGFGDLAMKHNDFFIYHYDKLFSEMVPLFGKDNIHLQRFESLVAGEYAEVNKFLGHPVMESSFSGLNNHNAKKKNDSSVFVPVRLKMQWLTSFYQAVGGRNTVVGRVLRFLGRYPVEKLRKINYRHVPVPVLTDTQRAQLKCKMSNTMEMMSEHFGVKY